MVRDTYIWLDYISVPQIGTYHDADVSDLMKAVESIPAYGKLTYLDYRRRHSPCMHQPTRLPARVYARPPACPPAARLSAYQSQFMN